ncbi:unnamed protein product, partial [Oikopleura dioica]
KSSKRTSQKSSKTIYTQIQGAHRRENCSKKRAGPELHRRLGSDSMSFDFGQLFHPSLLKQEAIGDEGLTGW